MLSQSLLFWDWRDCAALPDSSASNQAETTPGSRPVSAARRLAKVCWALVSWAEAPVGSAAPDTSPAAPIALVPWAAASAEANVDPVPVVVVDEAPAAVALVVAAGGWKAVVRSAICIWIAEMR